MRFTQDIFTKELSKSDYDFVCEQAFNLFSDSRAICDDLIDTVDYETLELYFAEIFKEFKEEINEHPNELRRLAISFLTDDGYNTDTVYLCTVLLNKIGNTKEMRLKIGSILFEYAKTEKDNFFVESLNWYCDSLEE